MCIQLQFIKFAEMRLINHHTPSNVNMMRKRRIYKVTSSNIQLNKPLKLRLQEPFLSQDMNGENQTLHWV